MDIKSIAAISTMLSSSNAIEKVSISLLKNNMEQSSENIMKILESAENLAPLPESNIDISI